MSERNDLENLAELHRRAFDRMRVLERKVAAIQENAEEYAQGLAEVLAEITIALYSIARDHRDIHLERLADEIQDMVPTLGHEHVYGWRSGIGRCLCGHTIEHARAGTDDNLYKNAPGSAANRRGGRRG